MPHARSPRRMTWPYNTPGHITALQILHGLGNERSDRSTVSFYHPFGSVLPGRGRRDTKGRRATQREAWCCLHRNGAGFPHQRHVPCFCKNDRCKDPTQRDRLMTEKPEHKDRHRSRIPSALATRTWVIFLARRRSLSVISSVKKAAARFSIFLRRAEPMLVIL
jgi:hypothetical protein